MNHITSKFWILLLIGAVLLSSCSSDDDTPADVPVVIPVLTALSDSTISPGDTLTLTGAKFASPASSNRVVFNNSEAASVPFFAAPDSLAVIVSANANTGGLYVTSKGVASNKINVLVEGRGVGDVWVVGGGSGYDFTVPVETGSERYLIIPHSATSTGVSYGYEVTPNNLPPAAAQDEAVMAGMAGTRDFAFDFTTAAREEAIEYLKTHEPREREPAREAPSSADTAAPASRNFWVLSCTGCSIQSPSSFATVTADLRYDGAHALIYSDVNQPTGGFTQADYDAFGANFDNSIYATNTEFFGSPTDIDNNGKIVILFTPRVNELTPDGTAQTGGFISGFVLFNDIAPNVFPAGTTNGGEVFYSMVPDPNGETGNTFPKTVVESVVPGTLAHEFEHMISNGYRFVVLGGGTDWRFLQQTWLEEGMAHMAEDLNEMDAQNILRANLYLKTPYATSLLGNAELRPYAHDTLEQRGGIFLYLRYLGDQFGEDIYKTIVQSPLLGEASIADVTDMEFHASMADYLATLYLSNRGITSNPRYNFTSFDFQDTFGALDLDNRSASAGGFSGAVRSATGKFYLVSGTQSASLKFGVSSSSSAVVRCVVVRTE